MWTGTSRRRLHPCKHLLPFAFRSLSLHVPHLRRTSFTRGVDALARTGLPRLPGGPGGRPRAPLLVVGVSGGKHGAPWSLFVAVCLFTARKKPEASQDPGHKEVTRPGGSYPALRNCYFRAITSGPRLASPVPANTMLVTVQSGTISPSRSVSLYALRMHQPPPFSV